LQLNIGIIAACAPTLRPLLGRALRLSTSLDPHRGANYWRAGKALDRLPVTANSARGYLRENTTSGDVVDLVKSEEQWVENRHGDSSFSATVIHAEHAPVKGVGNGEKSSSEGDAILPLADDPEFRGIIKTTEIRVEK
jgi:hypothetical protein